MILRPSVRMMRHPPEYVPALITSAVEILTRRWESKSHSGSPHGQGQSAPPHHRPFTSATAERALSLSFGNWRLHGLVGMHAKEPVDLFRGQVPGAGSRRHHEIRHQLDLGLEVIVCEVVALRFRCGHVTNLRGRGLAGSSNAAKAHHRVRMTSGRERLTARGRSWRLDLGPGATAARPVKL